MKYNKIIIVIIAFLVLGGVLGCYQMSVDDFQLNSNEEPFSSMVLPIKRVDAAVIEAFGNVISGDRVILVRLIDSLESEFFLAVTRDASGKYDQVFWDLPLVWRDGSGGLDGFGLPLDPPKEKYPLKEITNSRDAIKDLIRILSLFRGDYDHHDHTTEGAYETLKRGYYGGFMYWIRGGDRNRSL